MRRQAVAPGAQVGASVGNVKAGAVKGPGKEAQLLRVGGGKAAIAARARAVVRGAECIVRERRIGHAELFRRIVEGLAEVLRPHLRARQSRLTRRLAAEIVSEA